MGKYRQEFLSYLGFSVGLYLNYNNLDVKNKEYSIEVSGEFGIVFPRGRILSRLCGVKLTPDFIPPIRKKNGLSYNLSDTMNGYILFCNDIAIHLTERMQTIILKPSYFSS